MPILVPISLIGWIPLCLLLFVLLPRRQAVLVGVIGAWLFLPPSGIRLPGLPDYTKTSAFGYGIMLATLIFAPDRIARLRPSWLDVAPLVMALGPFVSSMLNGLGAYDGLAEINTSLSRWGLPYLIGRIHFASAREVRALATAVVAGGLVYIPICVFETVAGPILAPKLFAVLYQADIRFGTYRPRGFLDRGLELGFWMSGCSLLGLWLARCRALGSIGGLSFSRVLLPTLVATTVGCRSSGALGLLGMGLAVLWLSARFKQRVFLLAWLSSGLIYIAVRITNAWDYDPAVTFLQTNFSADRSQSLEFRLHNDDVLLEKAMLRPFFGWGGWGRSRVYDEFGNDKIITDGYCIIICGLHGVVGVLSFVMALVGPGFMFVARYHPRRWAEPDVGAMAATSSLLAMYMMDCMFNAFPNAVYMVMAGALASAVMDRSRLAAAAWDVESEAAPGAATAPPTAEDRLAARYVELARNARLIGDFEAAAEARRLAYDLLARRGALGVETPEARRRRLDCGNDLAWLLATRPDPEPGDREEAVELARASAEAEPDDPSYWNTLALALSRAGLDDDALAAAQRSMELEASWNAYDLAVLALALARLGRRDEAGRWLAEAVARRDRHDPTLDALTAEAEAALRP